MIRNTFIHIIYILKFQWREALFYADRLVKESKWSPCIYSYFKAAIYAQVSFYKVQGLCFDNQFLKYRFTFNTYMLLIVLNYPYYNICNILQGCYLCTG